jgi:predicted outer membrane repeat protein
MSVPRSKIIEQGGFMLYRHLSNATRCLSFFVVILSLWAGAAQAAGAVGAGTPASCTDAALDTALTGGGLVTFNCGGGAVTITVLTIKVISLNTTIDGGNLITLSGGGVRRVLAVNPSPATLTLQNLTIANAFGISGSGVQNDGTLIVTNSTFTANSAAPGNGGAIQNSGGGTVTITNSTFSGNTASNAVNGGGAIFNATGGGAITITNSTFTGNSATAGNGGAIYGDSVNGQISLRNVTISGNSAAGLGGGFYDNADNSATHNSIIANNTPNNCDGAPFPYISRYNLIGDASCGTSISGGIGNLINTNPLLAALAGNGGPTQTMALNAGSPAINTGSPSLAGIDICATVDQRGTTRPQGPRCDIGAFELVAAAVASGATGVPTLSEWTMIALMLMLGVAGATRMRTVK